MAAPRAEPFRLALRHLREVLGRGGLAPGTRITAVDLADSLRLSATPVREALAHLAGEGLVEDRRGLGYFVPRLSAGDIADLYRLRLAQLLIALEPARLRRAPPGLGQAPSGDAAAADPLEAVFQHWVINSGSGCLIRAFRSVQTQLGPVRRLEALAAPELAPGAAGSTRLLAAAAAATPSGSLASGAARGELLAQLRGHHSARIRQADRLAALLETAGRAGNIG
jgi:DNA-binding transcriptional MocR family regulator